MTILHYQEIADAMAEDHRSVTELIHPFERAQYLHSLPGIREPEENPASFLFAVACVCGVAIVLVVGVM